MNNSKASAVLAVLLFIGMIYSMEALAAIDSSGVFDTVLQRYQLAAKSWAKIVVAHASSLFWTLALISMVWTFGIMIIRQGGLNDFFAEFVRFTIFTGFFWWLLTNGPAFADSIITSLRQMGGEATGLGKALSPSTIVDKGFEIFDRVIDESSAWSPVDSFVGIILAGIILTILAIVGANMLVLLCTGWILAYAGVFFLGFGGSRWTSDLAINYYKAVLGIAASLFAMTLLIGIGSSILDQYYSQMSKGISLKEMAVLMIVCIILLYLIDKIPHLLSGVITGAGIGHGGVGNFGTGFAMGAMGMAVAGAGMAGNALAAGATNFGGGLQALKAAVSAASENSTNGEGMFSGAGRYPGQPRSYAEAMGHSGRFMADVGANLAKGGWDVTKDKVGGALQSFSQAARETLPGQISTAIDNSVANSNARAMEPMHDCSLATENSIGFGERPEPTLDQEVAAFVNKHLTN